MDLCDKHLKLVLQENQKINLTSITSFEEAKILHIEDSLTALDLLKEGELLDIGSGAGYPGIPLAIKSGLKTTLCETTTKKANCLEYFIKQLGLKEKVFVKNCRIEELDGRYNYITARALTALPSLLELASPLLKEKGLLICYKSKDYQEELNRTNKIVSLLGLEYIDTINKTLSNGIERTLILFQKVSDSKIKLPRKIGFAQKKPLA